ncbi:RNA-binding protein [Treponema ruminis]|uniref:RNA recognition motif-containing protein n=1 Tax=Treponema ruminis TaxID=744515 RepID=A0A7W8LM63_9SPIR|nr:RNA-binding protein [Treponema ruminis]MBB5226055.1 RNA recognition motif-containing protein [Treponema ruminis]QSI03036.1 RNA-binding protein [Treponema ruminis]
MRLYVGNLSYTTTEDKLRESFSNYGDVVSVQVMKDKFTEQSKGFGFVEMGSDVMGERAIGGMNGKDIDGRRIRVSEAVEKPARNGGAKRFFKDDGERPRRNFGEKRDFGERGGRERKPFRGDRSERKSTAEEY